MQAFLRKGSINTSGEVPYVEGELIVKFHEENVNLTTYMGEYALDTMAQSLSLEVVVTDENSNSALLAVDEIGGITPFLASSFPSNETTQELIESFQEDSRVEYVQPNFVYYPQGLPDDASFGTQTNLYNPNSGNPIRSDIHYPEAMDMITAT